MQTQRDHVHAHQFMMGRLGSALVQGDASGAEVPGRRALTGLVSGLLIAVLMVAGFGVYGWIVPGGSKAYRDAGLVLVEKETGSRYVFVDGLLRPVADLPTALLWQGANAKVKLISQASIASVPRGGLLGIPGGPREVPAPGRFVAGPWLVCLPEQAGGPGVAVNFDPGALSQPVPPERLALVRDPSGTHHLLTRGLRHRVADEAVLVALGVDTARAVPAPAIWLNQIPAGPDLAPAVIPRAGRNGPRVGDRAYDIGTRFRQDGLYFVLRADGLAAMSRTEFLFAGVRSRSEAVNLSGADLLAAPRSADRTLLDRLPDLAGAAEHRPGADQALCLSQRPDGTSVSSLLVEAPRFAAPADATGRGLVRGPAGGAMVVVGVPAAENKPPAMSLLSADGVAFPLKDATAAAALKINKVSPVPFPAEVLAEVRQGPMLSREAVSVLAEG